VEEYAGRYPQLAAVLRQISLGRRVALKVLPFAAAMDQKQLQRFKNEAQAAAHLHHTNIVPVFGVGCERGVHYYAMQYIEGRTLADVIVELRQQNGVKQGKSSPPLSEVAQEKASGRLAPAERGTDNGPPTTHYLVSTPVAAAPTPEQQKDCLPFPGPPSQRRSPRALPPETPSRYCNRPDGNRNDPVSSRADHPPGRPGSPPAADGDRTSGSGRRTCAR
jgi:hypothetical protein